MLSSSRHNILKRLACLSIALVLGFLLLLLTVTVAAQPIAQSAAAPQSAASDNAAINQSCGYEANVLADGPIAYWRLDETIGTTAENLGSIGNDVDGTYEMGVTQGVTGLVSSDPNLAAQFDGLDDYVDIPDDEDLNLGPSRPQRTIELWFSADTLSGTQVLYEEGGMTDGFNVFLDDDVLHVGAWDGSSGTWVTQTVMTGTAYYVAMVFDGNAVPDPTLTGYLNGTSFGSSATNFSAVSNHGEDNAIGAIQQDTRYPGGGVSAAFRDHFDGVIDDVAIYNDVLSPETIQLRAVGCAIPSTTTIDDDSPEPSVVGQPVTVTFSVTTTLPSTVTPTGDVTVTISGGSEFCVGTLSAGTGQCLITPTIAGPRTLTATYGGDASFTGSSDTEPHTVDQADTTTTITADTPEPSVVGEPVTVSFSVTADSPGSGTPTGNVTVTISGGPESCVDTLAAGVGQCLITPTSAGPRTLTATYDGDANYNDSSDTEPHAVDQADTTTTITADTPDPSALGEPVTVAFSVTATLPGSGTPTGNVTVTISSGSESCVGLLSAGGGQCLITPTITGTHTLTATYDGDANFTGSSDTEQHTVNEYGSTTSITADTPDPSVVGQPVTVIFSVTATLPDSITPTGKVTVTISGGSEFCVGTLAAGVGQCQITPTSAGSRTLTATYGGDTDFASSSDTAPHTVNKAGTTTTIIDDSPDPSFAEQPFTVEFSVEAISPGSGTPTGNVIVTISGGSESCVGTVLAGQCQITPTTAGNRTLTATYVGDANFNGSSGQELHTVNEAKLFLYLPLVFKP
jgi:hypothetical protein